MNIESSWFENSPEQNYSKALYLIYFEQFDAAKKILDENYKTFSHVKSKELLEKLADIKEFLEDIRLSIKFYEKRNYKKVLDILEKYVNSGMVTQTLAYLYIRSSINIGRTSNSKKLIDQLKEVGIENLSVLEPFKDRSSFLLKAGAIFLIVVISTFSTLALSFYVFNIINNKTNNQLLRSIDEKLLNILKSTEERIISTYLLKNEANSSGTFLDNSLINLIGPEIGRTIYKKALAEFKNENWKNAYKLFEIFFKYSTKDYLEQHALYYMALSAKRAGMGEAKQLFKKYIESSLNGEFLESVYFDSAIINLVSLLVQNEELEEARYYVRYIRDQKYLSLPFIKNLLVNSSAK